MSRLIDADALIDKYQQEIGVDLYRYNVIQDLVDAPTVNEWIPMSERPPEIGQYVLISTDMNYVATATFQGDYWQSNFDLDWEEVVAWQPTPKPFEVKENEKIVKEKEI